MSVKRVKTYELRPGDIVTDPDGMVMHYMIIAVYVCAAPELWRHSGPTMIIVHNTLGSTKISNIVRLQDMTWDIVDRDGS